MESGIAWCILGSCECGRCNGDVTFIGPSPCIKPHGRVGATTILKYSDADLQQLLDQLTKCYEGGKTFKEMVNLQAVRHPHSAFPEDSFQYLRRHTLGRPRDLVIIASELSKNQNALSEPGYRRLVVDTSAAVLVSNVFEEMRVFLDCLDDRHERLRFLSLLPHNILTRRDAIRIYCDFNQLDPVRFNDVGPDSEGMRHPFWELYSAGLLGEVASDPDGGKAVQRFKQPHDLLGESQASLPLVDFYLIHPSLDGLIRKQRVSGAYHVFHHITVGHNCPWEDYHGTLVDIERKLFEEPDVELRELVHDVLKEIVALLNAGRRREIATMLARSRQWAKVRDSLAQRRQDELYSWLQKLAVSTTEELP